LAGPEHFDVVCLSLEPWDQVWRRNQHLATRVLDLRPTMRLLFSEVPTDIALSLSRGHRPRRSSLRPMGGTGRLWVTTPRKWLPRRVWPRGDRSLGTQVLRASRRVGLTRPVLWINDSTYAPLVERTGWPSVYDVTDDWLLADAGTREQERQERNDASLLRTASEVVVCSPSLLESRGRHRPVHLISNGVDLDALRAPTERPADLPAGRTVVYQGTLSTDRLDIGLCVRLAQAMAGRASVVFVGPDSLSGPDRRALLGAGAVLLGSRPFRDIPAYLQHADLLVVPHVRTPFTESLDPIKAREFVAVGRRVVATPVAGFRDLDPPVIAAAPGRFVEAVLGALDEAPRAAGPGPLVHRPLTWATQAEAFLAVLDAAAESSRSRT